MKVNEDSVLGKIVKSFDDDNTVKKSESIRIKTGWIYETEEPISMRVLSDEEAREYND